MMEGKFEGYKRHVQGKLTHTEEHITKSVLETNSETLFQTRSKQIIFRNPFPIGKLCNSKEIWWTAKFRAAKQVSFIKMVVEVW